MVSFHVHKLLKENTVGPCEERTFSGMEDFVKIYNHSLDAFGSTRIKFFSIHDHDYVEGMDHYEVVSIDIDNKKKIAVLELQE